MPQGHRNRFLYIFVNLRSFRVENNTSLKTMTRVKCIFKTLPMFGTIFWKQSLPWWITKVSKQDVRKKETRCLLLRTTSFQSPGGEKLQKLPNNIFVHNFWGMAKSWILQLLQGFDSSKLPSLSLFQSVSVEFRYPKIP